MQTTKIERGLWVLSPLIPIESDKTQAYRIFLTALEDLDIDVTDFDHGPTTEKIPECEECDGGCYEVDNPCED